MLEILRDGFKSSTITVFNYAHLLKQLKCEGEKCKDSNISYYAQKVTTSTTYSRTRNFTTLSQI